MIIELAEWFVSLSGSMGKNYYISPIKNRPGYGIVRRKPGPRKPKDGSSEWVMPEAQARPVHALVDGQSLASRAYNDPAIRPIIDKEYDQWLAEQKRRGKRPYTYQGKVCSDRWAFARIRVAIDNPYR